jgi:hypothetical protein
VPNGNASTPHNANRIAPAENGPPPRHGNDASTPSRSTNPARGSRSTNLIATKKPRNYDIAVQLLADLHDLAERDRNTAPFRQRLAALRVEHARKPSLLERLDRAALDL